MELLPGMTVKIFVGSPITSEVRMHLNKSQKWKQVVITPIESRETQIQEIHFKGKDYLGYYLINETAKVPELQHFKSTLQALFKKYCPELQVESLKVYVLPQVFVS